MLVHAQDQQMRRPEWILLARRTSLSLHSQMVTVIIIIITAIIIIITLIAAAVPAVWLLLFLHRLMRRWLRRMFASRAWKCAAAAAVPNIVASSVKCTTGGLVDTRWSANSFEYQVLEWRDGIAVSQRYNGNVRYFNNFLFGGTTSKYFVAHYLLYENYDDDDLWMNELLIWSKYNIASARPGGKTTTKKCSAFCITFGLLLLCLFKIVDCNLRYFYFGIPIFRMNDSVLGLSDYHTVLYFDLWHNTK